MSIDPVVQLQAWERASASADRARVEVMIATGAADCTEIVDLFNEVWESPAGIDVLEQSTMVALAHSGNYVGVARDAEGHMVGASLGFFGPPGRPLHSHIAGVSAAAAGRGVGRALKLHQRAWCLQHGVDAITWTFDPLVARNAAFNITTLGARAVAYYPDHYGTMTDGLNAGHASDRMMMRWDLLDPPASADSPAPADSPGVTEVARVTVPPDIEALRRSDPASAMTWRAETRDAFSTLMNAGWQVTDFERPDTYVLTRTAEHPDLPATEEPL